MDKVTKFVILDFCGTVVDFQTLNPFLLYVLRKKKPIRFKLFNCPFVEKVCNYFTFRSRKFGYGSYLFKEMLIKQTKGISEEEMYNAGKEYFEKMVRPRYIGVVIELLKRCRQQGYTIIVVSGGSKYYIRYFCEEFGIKDCITAEIKVSNGIIKGKLLDDCLGEHKVLRLDDYLGRQKQKRDFYDVSVTDSISDLPLLKKSKKRIVISHKCRQEWVDKTMEEIIWE